MKGSLIFFLILFLGASWLFFNFAWQFFPAGSGSPEEIFIVSKKISQTEIAAKLEKEGFIKSQSAFAKAIEMEGKGEEISPGGYSISKSMSALSIAKVLLAGPVQKWVTLPEGLRKEESAEIFAKELGWDGSQKEGFLTGSREGYFFPETYLLDAKIGGGEAAEILSAQFDKEIKELGGSYDSGLGLEKTVVLASLVQRESRGAEEMPLVAGIILNRLNEGMKLDIDATLQYQMGSAEEWWPKVSSTEKSVVSDFNTYLNKGLPPSPICSPGADALKASMFPQESQYFYYLHDPSGQIYCAKTYEEHLANINKYLRPR
ncbi:MAG: endolytic transglycosylase MltG [Candidatus Paceibacterota bacterium]|jgi:UPF0755 protein